MAAADQHNLFYAPRERIRGGRIYFGEAETSHIVSSLRRAAGQSIAATDGAGRLYDAELEEAGRGGAVARITGTREVPPPEVRLTLFQGMIRPQRMDLLVEKCVELGADSIVPLSTERALQRDAAARLDRWNKIAVEAMKQSLRVYLPEVLPAAAFGEALGEARGLDLVLLAHEQETGRTLEPALLKGVRNIGLFVGPEGGFGEAEIEALKELGAGVFSLGGARLKSETAAIAAVALIRLFLR